MKGISLVEPPSIPDNVSEILKLDDFVDKYTRRCLYGLAVPDLTVELRHRRPGLLARELPGVLDVVREEVRPGRRDGVDGERIALGELE